MAFIEFSNMGEGGGGSAAGRAVVLEFYGAMDLESFMRHRLNQAEDMPHLYPYIGISLRYNTLSFIPQLIRLPNGCVHVRARYPDMPEEQDAKSFWYGQKVNTVTARKIAHQKTSFSRRQIRDAFHANQDYFISARGDIGLLTGPCATLVAPRP